MTKQILVLLISLGVVGGGVYIAYNQINKPQTQQTQTNQQKGEEKGFSVQQALQGNVSLKCEIDESGTKSTIYIKNGAVRSTGIEVQSGMTGEAIFKDNTFYMWTSDTNQGYKMQMDSFNIQNPEAPQDKENTEQNQSEKVQNIIKRAKQYKDSCTVTTVSDDMFVPPQNIEFVDFSQMMEQFQNQGEQNMEQMEEKAKEMQEKMQNSNQNLPEDIPNVDPQELMNQ